MSEALVRGFSVATRCQTIDEFVEKYYSRSDDRSILVNTVEKRSVGTECAFAILLANQQPVLAGVCSVLAIYTDDKNPFGRTGMRLGIERLGPESERVFAQLGAMRIARQKRNTMMVTPMPVMVVPAPVSEPDTRAGTIETAAPVRGATQTIRNLARHLENQEAVAHAVKPDPGKRRMTRPIRRIDAVQIPPVEASQVEAPLRTPRATPNNDAHTELAQPERELEQRIAAPAPTTTGLIARTKTRNGTGNAPATGTTPTNERGRNGHAAPKLEAKRDPTPSKERKLTPAPADNEGRARGSSLVLPANPLMNLTDASLEGLVDCRLFESTMTEPFEPDAPPPLDPPLPAEATITPGPTPAVPSSAVPQSSAGALATSAPLPIDAPLQLPGSVIINPRSHEARGQRPDVVPDLPRLPRGRLPDLPTPLVEPALASFVPSKPGARRIKLGRPLAVIGAFAVGFSAVAGWLALHAPLPQAPGLSPTATEPSDLQIVETAAESAVAIATVVGNGPCELGIVTTPPGAVVSVQGKRVGAAPISARGPCVRTRVTAELPNHLPAAQLVMPTSDQPVHVELALARPPHTVLVKTFPIAALVTYNGRSFGTTPTYVRVPGFTPVELKITRPGFAPVSYMLTSKEPVGGRVELQLKRAK